MTTKMIVQIDGVKMTEKIIRSGNVRIPNAIKSERSAFDQSACSSRSIVTLLLYRT